LLVASTAEIDAWRSDDALAARAWRTDASVFLPFLKARNQGIRVFAGILWQNRGSILNVDTFLPRGYDEDVFLGRGTWLKAGLEVIQPLWYVDRGLVLLPITLEAIYVFGFGETIGLMPGADPSYSSVGAGVGARVRLFHNIPLDLRVAAARRIEENDWAISFR